MTSKMERGVDPCQKQACAIQYCLQNHSYKEEKCSAIIREMEKCCAKTAERRATSICCSGFQKRIQHRKR
ncbi:cx9C motif-containing protein 4-like [Tubulanus polymorphus]|uniref:cx9C motif-containing protein 4-like n=1 Tax=Tubulanus polymorphus TaxID=672921 RepID=UPI003DA65154